MTRRHEARAPRKRSNLERCFGVILFLAAIGCVIGAESPAAHDDHAPVFCCKNNCIVRLYTYFCASKANKNPAQFGHLFISPPLILTIITIKEKPMDFDVELDAVGLTCPMPIMKAKKIMKTMESGQVLHVEATDPTTVPDFDALIEAMDQFELSHHEKIEDKYHYYIKMK
jgi:tRNA 2-thiouridine synthesizing protein A